MCTTPFFELGAKLLKGMAGTTGLEPAASAVTECLLVVTDWNSSALTAKFSARSSIQVLLTDPNRTRN